MEWKGKQTSVHNWKEICKNLSRNTLFNNRFQILESVFFHPVAHFKPIEMTTVNRKGTLLVKKIGSMSFDNVALGCAISVTNQSKTDEESWSDNKVAIAIKGEKYKELSLLDLCNIEEVLPGGIDAVVLTKLEGIPMMEGVFVHQVRKDITIHENNIWQDNEKISSKVQTLPFCHHIRETTWRLIKAIESIYKLRCLHIIVLYKVSVSKQNYCIAHVLKCVMANTLRSLDGTTNTALSQYEIQTLLLMRKDLSSKSLAKLPLLHSYQASPNNSFYVDTQDEGVMERNDGENFDTPLKSVMNNSRSDSKSSSPSKSPFTPVEAGTPLKPCTPVKLRSKELLFSFHAKNSQSESSSPEPKGRGIRQTSHLRLPSFHPRILSNKFKR